MTDDRRGAVLESALETFARDGYRRTSMDTIAAAAQISRPGLYFLFESKESLFREATAHVLSQDLAAIERTLADTERPLDERVLDAFERWAGRWIGAGARDVPAVIAANPSLVDETARAAPAAFERLLTAAVADHVADPTTVAQTLISVSVGLKHQVDSPDDHRARLRAALGLVLT